VCPDNRYPKLNIYISDLILDSYKYISVASITKHCMILAYLKWVQGGFLIRYSNSHTK